MPEAQSLSSATRQRRLLARLAWACAILVLAITTLSASMRLAKNGIGCAPWPQCYGQAAGGQAGGGATEAGQVSDGLVAQRLAHRMLALATLALIVVMLALALKAGAGLRREQLELAALLAVTLFLAVLGALGAQSALPAVALGNLLGGFAMLALSARLAARRSIQASGALRAGLWLACLLLLAQILLGGMASASQSILSCDGWAGCAAAAQGGAWAALDPWRMPAAGAGALAQWAHRLGAAATLIACLVLAFRLRAHDARGAGWFSICVLAQFALGLVLHGAGFPMALVLLHNVLAALALALIARWL